MFFKLLKLGCLYFIFINNTYAVPDIQHWQTSNGAQVYFVPAMSLPMADIRIVFDAGSARDNGQAGLAVLTNGLLAEGAGQFSAQQLSERFENVGASFSNGALKDMAWLSLRSLTETKYFQPALDNLKTILTQASFPQDAYRRVLSQMKLGLQASKQSPSSIAKKAFYKALYRSHPYASPSEGSDESLASMQLAQVKKYYQQYYVANNAVVAIVGQLSRQQAEKIAEDLLVSLPAGKTAPAIARVKPLQKASTLYIDFPSKQSHIFIGQTGMRRGDPDYFTLYVANHPFGGSGFASRLVDEVREKRGLAYSVYSYFSAMREDGPFMLGLQTRNDQAEQALKIIKQELKRYVQEGPTAKELDASLKNITGGFPLLVDSNRKLTEYLTMIGFYHLPLDYLNTFVDNMKAVNLEKINETLQRRIQPNKMVTIIVGGSKKEKENASKGK